MQLTARCPLGIFGSHHRLASSDGQELDLEKKAVGIPWSFFLLKPFFVERNSGVSGVNLQSDGSDRPECSQVEWRETAQRVIEEEQQRRAELQIEQ